MNWVTIATPLLALAGALIGGYLTQLAGGRIAEQREDRRLLREARVALERCVATRVGPMDLQCPGISSATMGKISEQAVTTFFERYLTATFEAKAALGAVRHFDERIAKVLDEERWDIPIEQVEALRTALQRAERSLRITG